MITTANFKTEGNNPNAVAVSCSVPTWYKGKRYKPLAPPWYVVDYFKKGKLSEKEYTWYYQNKVLAELNKAEVKEALGKDAILLCWEDEGEFCHRNLILEWLEE